MTFSCQTTVTTYPHTVPAFPGDRLSSILLNLSAKIFRLSLGCHPLDGVGRGRAARTAPPHPLVTPLPRALASPDEPVTQDYKA